jgi:hypothetical protein
MTLQREALLENLKAAKQIAKASHDQGDRQKMTIEALAAIGADTYLIGGSWQNLHRIWLQDAMS